MLNNLGTKSLKKYNKRIAIQYIGLALCKGWTGYQLRFNKHKFNLASKRLIHA